MTVPSLHIISVLVIIYRVFITTGIVFLTTKCYYLSGAYFVHIRTIFVRLAKRAREINVPYLHFISILVIIYSVFLITRGIVLLTTKCYNYSCAHFVYTRTIIIRLGMRAREINVPSLHFISIFSL